MNKTVFCKDCKQGFRTEVKKATTCTNCRIINRIKGIHKRKSTPYKFYYKQLMSYYAKSKEGST